MCVYGTCGCVSWSGMSQSAAIAHLCFFMCGYVCLCDGHVFVLCVCVIRLCAECFCVMCLIVECISVPAEYGCDVLLWICVICISYRVCDKCICVSECQVCKSQCDMYV